MQAEQFRENIEAGRKMFREAYRQRRQEEEEAADDERPPVRWTDPVVLRRRDSQRKQWAPLPAAPAPSHDGRLALLLTEAVPETNIMAMRLDLVYLCSQHGRQLPPNMSYQDPVDDRAWALLLTAHVMIREEEEPRVGGGCWMWSISVRPGSRS